MSYEKSIRYGLAATLMFFVVTSLVAVASAEFEPANADLPDFFNFDENYYTVYGGPDITATIVGDSEFDKGDTVTLNFNLMNKGVITGFKSEEDNDPLTDLEQKLQQSEMSYESQRTTAIGIVAILTPLDPAIKVKSGPQEAGTLASGEQTESPVKFNVEISNNAASGTYPMLLSLYYGYQKNVQINGDNETDLGITNMDVGLWYDVGSQNVTIPIYVSREADFAVTNVTGQLYPDSEGMLYVTYKNTGQVTANDATVRISAADPFSTTDDQAFLGSLGPGETGVAVFKLKVDELAVPKLYAINSEIKYEDMDGHDQISDTVKIKTDVLESTGDNGGFVSSTMIIGGVVVVVLGAAGFFLYRRMSAGKGGE